MCCCRRYKGLQNKTRLGYTCQKWSSQSPHKHVIGLTGPGQPFEQAPATGVDTTLLRRVGSRNETFDEYGLYQTETFAALYPPPPLSSIAASFAS